MDMNSPSVVLAFSNFKIIGLSEKYHDTTHYYAGLASY